MRWLAAIGLLVALAACSRKEQVAGVVVRIDSDLRVPEQLDAVELRVDVTGAPNVVQHSFSLDRAAPAAQDLPIVYGLYPKEGKGGQFTVVAVGMLKGTEVVRRSASLSFPTAGPTVLLQLPLLASCSGHPCVDPLTTCVGAAICRSHEVFVGELQPYRRGAGDPIVGGESDAGADGPARDLGVPPSPDATTDQASVPVDLARPAEVQPPPDLAPDTLAPDSAPGCIPRPEACFNNADEDCDGLIDCADPDCTPSVAVCVPADLDDNPSPGFVTSSSTCPAGFNQTAPTLIRNGPSGGPCTGCACGPAAAACDTAQVFSYPTSAECMAAPGATGGLPTTPPTFTRAEGCKVPQYMGGFMGGIRVAPMTPQLAACAASGMAAPGAVTWATTARFCPTVMRGGGCAAGRLCVPRPPPPTNPPPACVLYLTARACPAGTTKYQNLDWYTAFNDGRTCSACTCAAPTGGSCAGVTVHIGNDYTCNPNNGDLAPGTKMCYPGNIYVPGLRIDGTGTAGSCAPRTTVSGSITPTGPRTVCCQ